MEVRSTVFKGYTFELDQTLTEESIRDFSKILQNNGATLVSNGKYVLTDFDGFSRCKSKQVYSMYYFSFVLDSLKAGRAVEIESYRFCHHSRFNNMRQRCPEKQARQSTLKVVPELLQPEKKTVEKEVEVANCQQASTSYLPGQCRNDICSFSPLRHVQHPPPFSSHPISMLEKTILIDYLIRYNCIEEAKTKKLYERMHNDGYLTHRTVESLRNCFRRTILDNLKHYAYTPNVMRRLEAMRENQKMK